MSYVNQKDKKAAFGENLVVEPHPLFQSSFEFTVDNTDIATKTIVGSGTVTQTNAMAVASTGTTAGSVALFQSKQHAKYRSGFGGDSRFTMKFTTPVAGTSQYQGLIDERGSSAKIKNGFTFGYTGTTFGVQRWRNDVLVEEVAQASWDLNPSWFNHTNLTPAQIQFQYLGGGAIEFFIENPNTGLLDRVHTMQRSSQDTTPTVYNPNFYVGMLVDNGATTSNVSVSCASWSYTIQGKTAFTELQQPQHSSNTLSIAKTSITTEKPAFTIRNKSTYASKTNFIDIVLEYVSCSIEANTASNQAVLRLIKNASLTGASYSDINTNNSVCDKDTSATSFTGGEEIISFPLIGKNDGIRERLLDMKIILSSGDTVTVAVQSVNSADFRFFNLVWKELF